MFKSKYALLLGIAGALLAVPAFAQEGCRNTTQSCTQIFNNCSRNCQSANNVAGCVARICSGSYNECKANGLWKSTTSAAACWRTNNRS